MPPSGPGAGGGQKGTATNLPGGPRPSGGSSPQTGGPEREVKGAYTSGSTASGARAGADAAPGHGFDAHAVPDAVPIDEPRSRYGNKSPYVVFGKTYKVMDDATGYVERGVASWYGAKFHGAKTSSGEPYDMYSMSAAHKTLPLPTYARVTNIETGASVVVRVNDRGPFKDDRVMDLSYAAATRLGITAKGTGLVEVRVVGPGDVAAVPPGDATVKVLDDGGLGEATPYNGEEPTPPAAAPAVAASAAIAAAAATSSPAGGAVAVKPLIAPLTADDMALKPPPGAAPKPAPIVPAPALAPAPAPAATVEPKPAPVVAAVAPAVAKPKPAPAVAKPKPKPAPPEPTTETVSVANPFSPAAPAPSGTVLLATTPDAAKRPPAIRPSMWLQVGAFGDEANANRVRVRLAALGLPTATKRDVDATGKRLYKIRVGPYEDATGLDVASAALDAVGLKGYATVVE